MVSPASVTWWWLVVVLEVVAPCHRGRPAAVEREASSRALFQFHQIELQQFSWERAELIRTGLIRESLDRSLLAAVKVRRALGHKGLLVVLVVEELTMLHPVERAQTAKVLQAVTVFRPVVAVAAALERLETLTGKLRVEMEKHPTLPEPPYFTLAVVGHGPTT
jgi:hypothetical protein